MTKLKDHIKEVLILIRDKLVKRQQSLTGKPEEVGIYEAQFVLRLMNTMLDESGQLLSLSQSDQWTMTSPPTRTTRHLCLSLRSVKP